MLTEDKKIAQKYDGVIKEQLKEGTIEGVTENDCATPSGGAVIYLTHQYV